MATFTVGQRVKIVVPFLAFGHDLNGIETRISGEAVPTRWGPGYPTQETDYRGLPGVLAHCLVPLTDPGFDAFMQSVLKPVNLDQPVTVQ